MATNSSKVYFGNLSQNVDPDVWNSSAIGWNGTTQIGFGIFGNTMDDTFLFANQAWITDVTGNQGWMFNGAGGNDTLSFASSTAAVNFNFAQIDPNYSSGVANSFAIIGSSLADSFSWNNADFTTSPFIKAVDGGVGSDTLLLNGTGTFNFAQTTLTNIETIRSNGTGDVTLIFGSTWPTGLTSIVGNVGTNAMDIVSFSSATAGVSVNVNNSLFVNIDQWKGGSLADTFYWDGAQTVAPNMDGGAGNNVLTLSAAGGTVNVNDSNILNFNSFVGSSGADAFRWNGAGPGFTLNGASGTDTLFLYNVDNTDFKKFVLANAHMTNVELLVGTSYNDNVFWSGADTLNFDLGAGTADTIDISTSTVSGGKLIDLASTQFVNIEVVNGSNYADSLRGSIAAETLFGGAGGDKLWGFGGNDYLNGGAGADTYYFGAGDGSDSIVYDAGNSSSDVVRFEGSLTSHTFDQLNFNVYGGGSGDGIGNDLIVGLGTDSLTLSGWVNYSGTTGASTANSKRVNTFITSDATFGLAMANEVGTSLFGTVSSMNYYMRGGLGNDTLLAGTSSNDRLYGMSNNDLFQYSGAASLFDGGNDTDTLSAAALTSGVNISLSASKFVNLEVLEGTSVGDTLGGASTTVQETLIGGAGADWLWGAGGNDSLVGGAGADTYWFGSGDGVDSIASDSLYSSSDRVVFTGTTATAFSSLSFNAVAGGAVSGANDVQIGIGTDTLQLQGWINYNGSASAQANSYRVNTFVTSDATFGLAMANDIGTSLGGTVSTLNYYMKGGLGNDTLKAGTTVDRLYGMIGNDLLQYSTTAFVLDGGNDTDTLSAASSAAAVNLSLAGTGIANFEALVGSSMADTLGGASTTVSETIVGSSGADWLWGAGGNDSLSGGSGADTYWFGSGDGADSIGIDSLNSQYDVVTFQGTSTTAFSSLNFGVSGQTNLLVGIGTDSLQLNDWVNYSGSSATNLSVLNKYRVNTFVTSDATFGLAIGNDTATSLAGTISTMNYWMKGGLGDDTLKAGSASADRLYGMDGNDILRYSATAGLFDGGNDTDTLSASGASTIDLRNTATYTNIEYLSGSSLADKLAASGAHADTVNGGSGSDSIYGGLAYNDVLIGGAGADTYWFGALDGADTITEDATGVNNKLDAVAFYGLNFSALSFTRTSTNDLQIGVNASQGYSDNLTLANWGTHMDDSSTAGATRVNRVNSFITTDMTFGLAIGTTNPDTLVGTSLVDYMVGGDGADVLNGKGGADAIYGGEGADTIYYTSTASAWLDGGNDVNTLTASASTTAVSIDLTSTHYLNFTNIVGSSLGDILGGTSVSETISGGAGADSLWGGRGTDADSLIGGTGSDSYWFGVGDGADTIGGDLTNNIDYVMFYGDGIGGGGITSTTLNGDTLTIGLSSGDSLTLENWKKTDGSKVNNFNFGSAGTYQLSVTDDNVATWTLRT